MGLTHDDRRLIMGDGSSRLQFLDPETFAELGHLEVFDGGPRISSLLRRPRIWRPIAFICAGSTWPTGC
jgi:hypothetical protein